MSTRITIRLSDEEYQALSIESKRRKVKLAWLVRERLFNAHENQAQDLSELAIIIGQLVTRLGDIESVNGIQNEVLKVLLRTTSRIQNGLFSVMTEEIGGKNKESIYAHGAKLADDFIAKLGI